MREDDYTLVTPQGIEFMQAVVTLAFQNGKEFNEVNPAIDIYVKKNYKLVIADVESIGAQINAYTLGIGIFF